MFLLREKSRLAKLVIFIEIEIEDIEGTLEGENKEEPYILLFSFSAGKRKVSDGKWRQMYCPAPNSSTKRKLLER